MTAAPLYSESLKNPGLFLEPADVFHDLIDVVGRHPFDLRHVAELPVVRSDAVGRGILEGRITVMIGLVNLMDERGALTGSHRAGTMTARTIGGELLFAVSIFRRSRSCRARLRRIALAACRGDADQQAEHHHTQ